jgi:hypothetical protein
VAKNRKQPGPFGDDQISFVAAILMVMTSLVNIPSAMATTKGLSQIVTPDLQEKETSP